MASKVAMKTQLVGAVMIADGKVLLCHRSKHRRWYPDTWDLAGGHVERGETSAQALVRELQEELGVRISEPAGPPIAHFETPDADRRIWAIRKWAGIPVNAAPLEHSTIGWFGLSDVESLPLAHPVYLPMIAKALEDTRRDGG